MINSKEVRLGNITAHKSHVSPYKYVEIDSIYEHSVQVKEVGSEGRFSPIIPYADLIGIPLTPERLVEACGVTDYDKDRKEYTIEFDAPFNNKNIYKIAFNLSGCHIGVYRSLGKSTTYFVWGIKELHVFQNWYYLLSGGHELPVNIDKLTTK